jgi:hypothetical protein
MERDHLEDAGVDGRIILKWIFRKWNGGTDWIDLVQCRDKWRSLVNAVINFFCHKMRVISWLAEKRLASQEGPCSMAYVSI